MRLDAAIQGAAQRLASISDSARLDAELLLCQTIDTARSYLMAHPDDELDALGIERYEALIRRRLDGEPIAYIAGTREFWSHNLLVSPATLVPRPETERVVELALREIPKDAAWQILDLGTGSGAIAIAIAGERPLCDVTATDNSAAALGVARENLRQANLANVVLLEGCWTEPIQGGRFELIVCNPPYIGAADSALDALRHEPLSALAAGTDGLDDIRILACDCPDLLAVGGQLILEHGAEQQQAVAELLSASGWSDITCHNDLAGKPRVTVARWNGT